MVTNLKEKKQKNNQIKKKKKFLITLYISTNYLVESK